jgi:hypothetical protein
VRHQFTGQYRQHRIVPQFVMVDQRWLALSEQRFAPDKWIPCRLLT